MEGSQQPAQCEYNYINDLQESRSDWAIQVRVTRMWESFRKGMGIESLNMVLLDEQNHHIEAVIDKVYIDGFQHRIKEGSIYMVKNFSVEPHTEQYKVVANGKKINIHSATIIEELDEESSIIECHKFEFANYECIMERRDNLQLLSDLVGRLTSVSNVIEDDSNGSRLRRRIIGMSIDGHDVRLALFGKHADHVPEMYGQNPVIVITSTIVKTYQQGLSISSSKATKIYLDLDIPEVNAIKNRASTFGQAVRRIDLYGKDVTIEEVTSRKKTIKELLDYVRDSKNPEATFYVEAKIKGVNEEIGWKFIGCNVCRRKLGKRDEKFFCHHCNTEPALPLPMYRIELIVEDDTASTTFVLFNEEACKLLDVSASDLALKVAEDPANPLVPAEIIQLADRSYIFRIKVTNYNFTTSRQNFTVLRSFNKADIYSVIRVKEEDILNTPKHASRQKTTIDDKKADGGVPNAVSPKRGETSTRPPTTKRYKRKANLDNEAVEGMPNPTSPTLGGTINNSQSTKGYKRISQSKKEADDGVPNVTTPTSSESTSKSQPTRRYKRISKPKNPADEEGVPNPTPTVPVETARRSQTINRNKRLANLKRSLLLDDREDEADILIDNDHTGKTTKK